MRLGADELIDFQTATSSSQRRLCGDAPRAVTVRTFASITCQRESAAVLACATVETSDLDLLVDAIRGAATCADIGAPHRPWLDPLAADMRLDALPPAALGDRSGCDPQGELIVGVVDDPDGQTRRGLTWPSSSGHLLLVGAPGSGTTTALLELAATFSAECRAGTAADSPAEAELYIIDANGDHRWDAVAGRSCCAGVVRLHEAERLLRLLDHLCRVIDTRRATVPSVGAVARATDLVVLIDGLAALRTELNQAEQWQQLDQLERIVAEGLNAGIRVAMSVERPGAVPSAMLGQIARRWVFHLSDPFDAGVLGLSAAVVPPPVAGRLFDTVEAAEAQVVAVRHTAAHDAHDAHERGEPRRGHRWDRLGELPAEIDVAALPDSVAEGGAVLAPIGVAFDDLRPAVLPIAGGEHVLVIGPARSGRTTALDTIVERWSSAHPDGWVGSVARRRSSACPGVSHPDIAALVAAMPNDRPVLAVIDDAELVDDPTGVLAALITDRRDHVTVVAAGRGDSLRANYGHWSAAVRRSRLGLVMAAANDLDGDLLGATLPRRLPIPARPGLAWLIADGDRRLMQVAVAPSTVGAAFPA